MHFSLGHRLLFVVLGTAERALGLASKLLATPKSPTAEKSLRPIRLAAVLATSVLLVVLAQQALAELPGSTSIEFAEGSDRSSEAAGDRSLAAGLRFVAELRHRDLAVTGTLQFP